MQLDNLWLHHFRSQVITSISDWNASKIPPINSRFQKRWKGAISIVLQQTETRYSGFTKLRVWRSVGSSKIVGPNQCEMARPVSKTSVFISILARTANEVSSSLSSDATDRPCLLTGCAESPVQSNAYRLPHEDALTYWFIYLNSSMLYRTSSSCPSSDVVEVKPGKLIHKASNWSLSMAYTGKFNPGQGLYRSSSFTYQPGRESVLLVTQLESHGARHLFPCIDEPSSKVCSYNV